MKLDRFRPGYRTALAALLFTTKACEAPPPTPADVITHDRTNAKPGIEETYTCINPIGTLVSVGSTEGPDTCTAAFTQVTKEGEIFVFSDFNRRAPEGGFVQVCKRAKIKGKLIIDPNTVITVGTSCADLLNQPKEVNE